MEHGVWSGSTGTSCYGVLNSDRTVLLSATWTLSVACCQFLQNYIRKTNREAHTYWCTVLDCVYVSSSQRIVRQSDTKIDKNRIFKLSVFVSWLSIDHFSITHMRSFFFLADRQILRPLHKIFKYLCNTREKGDPRAHADSAFAQSDQGLRCPFTAPLFISEYKAINSRGTD